ncbi:MAG: amidohydrolase family protein [Gammaproteobacteria bacterium]
MLRDRLRLALVTMLLAAAPTAPAAVQVGVSEGTNIAVAASPDGEHVVFDLYGRLWRVAITGGMASPITGPELRLTRPDVASDGRIVAQGDDGSGQKLWLVHPDGRTERLTADGGRDSAPRWHPGGRRVAFASDRTGNWDLYELDIAEGQVIRLTDTTTEETDPTYSASGDRLAWITRTGNRWELWLREAGMPGRLLYSAPHRLSAPSIRPDGTVIVIVEDAPEGGRLTAVILSDPVVAKPLSRREDFFRRPTEWLDRDRMIYTADGQIRFRNFGELHWHAIPWTAWISAVGPPAAETRLDGTMQSLHHGRYVVRAGGLFDGRTPHYRRNVDVLVEDDRIADVVEQQDWPDTDVITFPDAVLMPGLIQLGLSESAVPDDGSLLLGCGVTTVVELPASPGGRARDIPGWSDGSVPGPTLLTSPASDAGMTDVRSVTDPAQRLRLIGEARRRNETVITDRLYPDIAAGASLLTAGGDLPLSPAGRRYADVSRLLAASGARLIAGVGGPGSHAESRIAGESPLATLLAAEGEPAAARLTRSCVVQAHMQQLQRNGVPPIEVLRRHTAEPARTFGLEGELGVLTPGARADLLIVSGDPLADAADAIDISAVITGGRFFTPAGLLWNARPSSHADSSGNLTIKRESDGLSVFSDSL